MFLSVTQGYGDKYPLFFFVCWQIEQVRFILNSFHIKGNLEVHKQQLLRERCAESYLTNRDGKSRRFAFDKGFKGSALAAEGRWTSNS